MEISGSFRRALRFPPLGCLVCGVDSGPIRTFLFVFIGALVGTSLSLLAWAILTGRLKDKPEMSELVFEAERKK